VFLSGLLGVPPLLIVGPVAGAVQMPWRTFATAVFLGRTLQSWAILVGFELTFDTF
jgi:membrane protein YqaA with SNARE-associated domain